MGGGIKYSEDSAKGPPKNILAELAASGAPAFKEATEFCVRPPAFEFKAIEDATVHANERVELGMGAPPPLVSDGKVVGHVLGPVGQALNGCLSMNFKLVGVVASFDAATRVGRATLAGVRQQAA